MKYMYAKSRPYCDDEVVLEVVDDNDYDAFSPDLLADPPIRTAFIESSNPYHLLELILALIATYPEYSDVNAISINTSRACIERKVTKE